MSAVVGYVIRSDCGAWIDDALVVGDQALDRWGPGAPEESLGPAAVSRAVDAASWMMDRLEGRRVRGKRLDRLVIDTDGALASWLDAPSAESSVVQAAAGQAEGSIWNAEEARSGGTSIEALSSAASPSNGVAEGASLRLPILVAPDAGVRVLLDELDRRGASVGAVESLWHAACQAWDPSARDEGGGVRTDRLVAESGLTTAVILVDPRGRLVWAWSRAGELIAAGRVLLASTADDGDTEASGRVGAGLPAARVGEADLSRLASDWLAWTMQTGQCPSRVVCVTPELAREVEGDLASAGDLGRQIGERWPQTSVDLIVESDPLVETLRRAVDEGRGSSGEGPGRSMAALSRRPGRSHRSFYRWVALMVLAASAALVALGLRWRGEASAARSAASALEAEVSERYLARFPEGTPAFATLELDNRIRALNQRLNATSGVKPAPPIVDEFESIILALSSLAVEWEQIDLVDLEGFPANTVTLWAPRDNPTNYVSRVLRALDRAPGSLLYNWEPDYTRQARGDKERVRLRAVWLPRAFGNAGGQP